jgi:AAA+ superfamily predicted ATPase
VDERLIESLAAAVRAAPDDLPLRLHLAGLLVVADRGAEAVEHVATALAKDPTSAPARELMARAMGTAPTAADPAAAPAGPSGSSDSSGDAPPAEPSTFDWHAAESDLGETVGPMFVDGSTEDPGPSAYDVEAAGVRLADVGGLTEVKKRLEASFLAPLRNPELRALYGKSLRGGLLLYGPPGCGKTFLAKAVAGELGASFLHVSLADVLDMYIGQSERNVKELFEVARTSAPCVLFLDELDAIGGKRSLNRSSGARTTVNQLLTELDGVGSDNEGVFVLAATNHPWDVDPALRRPGRLDRTLLVLPPDREAREAILRTHLRDRPVERIDTRRLARATEGFSGADLAHLCESASENALMDSVGSGQVRMIGMSDFDRALSEIRPSIGPWVETARNVALYANASGEYDELATWLRKRR